MKVAVTATGPDVASDVDPRFGRARWVVVVDTETNTVEVLDNSEGVQAASGAGVQAAARVAKAGAEYLLTGHCGPNAFRALDAAGIKVVTGLEGTIQGALDRLARGELAPSRGADVGGHW
jgi:predicted Fe-Mo cluster-binding NifX family protein